MKWLWIAIALIVIGFVLFAPKDFQSNNALFQADQWRYGDYRVRGTMCRDLSEKKILIGKTRSEVKNILGEPEQDYDEFTKYAIDLGSIWERWMIRYNFMIDFDKETGLVTSAHLMDA